MVEELVDDLDLALDPMLKLTGREGFLVACEAPLARHNDGFDGVLKLAEPLAFEVGGKGDGKGLHVGEEAFVGEHF